MQIGDRVAGRFVIASHAGAGGMADVYRARDEERGRDVALKVMRSEMGAAGEKRFAREAAVLAAIAHPAVVRYLTHGVTDTGRLFMAMEWLEGRDLEQQLGELGPLPPHDALALVRSAASGLAEAHRRGHLGST